MIELEFEIPGAIEAEAELGRVWQTAAPVQIPVTSATAIARMLTGRMIAGTATITETEV